MVKNQTSLQPAHQSTSARACDSYVPDACATGDCAQRFKPYLLMLTTLQVPGQVATECKRKAEAVSKQNLRWSGLKLTSCVDWSKLFPKSLKSMNSGSENTKHTFHLLVRPLQSVFPVVKSMPFEPNSQKYKKYSFRQMDTVIMGAGGEGRGREHM